MSYAKARQREDSGLWDWSVMNNRIIHRHEPCTEACQHATQEEADKHFYEWSLSQVREYFDPDLQHKCAVCGAWTQKSLGNHRFWMIGFDAFLCDEHRNKDELVKLHPFQSPIGLIYS